MLPVRAWMRKRARIRATLPRSKQLQNGRFSGRRLDMRECLVWRNVSAHTSPPLVHPRARAMNCPCLLYTSPSPRD
eukprot:910097-Alexandrium_andersonii.AAC.1